MEENKKIKRVGIFTFGITLVLFGITILLQSVISMDLFRYVLKFWPIILIILGCEILYYSRKNINIKYDIFSIILIFIVAFLGLVLSFASFFVNQVIYKDDFKNAIVDTMQDRNYSCSFENKCSIYNMSDLNVNLDIKENENFDSTSIDISFNIQDRYKDNAYALFTTFNDYRIYEFLEFSDDSLVIKKVPNYVESINITVYTNNKDNINYTND